MLSNDKLKLRKCEPMKILCLLKSLNGFKFVIAYSIFAITLTLFFSLLFSFLGGHFCRLRDTSVSDYDVYHVSIKGAIIGASIGGLFSIISLWMSTEWAWYSKVVVSILTLVGLYPLSVIACQQLTLKEPKKICGNDSRFGQGDVDLNGKISK